MPRREAAYDPDPLEVGDRVRVRISGESDHAEAAPLLDGKTGEVIAVVTPGHDWANPGHPYLVQMDPPFPVWSCAYLARIELNRIRARDDH